MQAQPDTYRFGSFLLDARRRVLEQAGEGIELQPKLFDTLLFLVRNADRSLSKDELLATIWPGTVVTEHVLTRVVRALRVTLGDDATAPRYIKTIRGIGYRFVEPVRTSPAETSGAPPRSLAVLPFRSIVGSKRDESLELGLADTLIVRLGGLDGLVVRPLGSTLAVLERSRDPAAAAATLAVDAYLEASLQIAGETLRVNVRLVSTEAGASLWSESFDEPFVHVFELQDAICERIVAELAPRTSGRIERTSRRTSPEAFREFLWGRVFLGRHTPSDARSAIEHFERALDEDPTYADAWAGLGESHELIGTEGGPDAARCYASARRCALRALAIAPALADAECLVAKIAWQHDWDWAGAEEAFRRVLDRHPHHAEAHVHFADFCCLTGRAAEGLAHARTAVALDPVSPWCGALLAQAMYMDHRYEEALSQAEATLELAPGFAFAQFFAGLARFCSGDREAGLAWIEAAARSGRADFRGALALCYGRAGRHEEAAQELAELESLEESAPFALAIGHLGCGAADRAIELLERCLERKDWQVTLLLSDPLFAPLRDTPGIAGIVARLGSSVEQREEPPAEAAH